MKLKTVTIIPARGGSKGIPLKNLVNIKGKPLIWYSINASINSSVSETWVSTDHEGIKDVSKKFGAKTILRPKELCDDFIMPDASLIHFAENVEFDVLVFIQPTSPLIKPSYINSCIEKVVDEGYDSVFTVHEEHWIPKWSIKNDEKFGVDVISPFNWDMLNRPRRQDKESLYVENGMLYVSTRESLLSNRLRYGGKIGFVIIPIYDSFQVDSFEDLELVRRVI